MLIKTIFSLIFILNFLVVRATEVEIDVSQLKRNSPIFLSESGVYNRIPESGTLKISVEHLPTLIRLISLDKSKIVTHQVIWLTGNILKIKGSIDDDKIELFPNNMGEQLDNDIEHEWKQVDVVKKKGSTISERFLVYLLNSLKFQETANLKAVIETIPKNERDFWATARIVKYLNGLESIGFDPSENQFEYLTAMNKNGEDELFEKSGNKFLLIDFSASSCRPCLEDIDKLVKLNEDFENELDILSIWDDSKQEAWLNVAKKQKDKITWVSLRDDSGAIFEKFEVNVYPTYLLIDRTGSVVKKWKGKGVDKVGKYLE
ncbi:TlpA family protein disulfide reductase [Arcticibacterium luteifluviistationis]|uniref:Thioredoxin domain-containing protein n=1 Tax=Arcticibacterium luteifluviistationis TaxID=1784714 RepID=A0A2Z4GDB1_9BACT|nr:TlpA disulfide reductase family protein [Arcticibacterium luteifluviistationis]AWV99226.1 hypothetical protein DJ013_14040 [Arcticibacterium luteifluviistationis]